MISFLPITLADRQWAQPLFWAANARASEYCFSNNLNWGQKYDISLARMDDYLLVKSIQSKPSYLFPAGRGDIRPVVEALVEDAQSQGHPFLMHSVSPGNKELLEQLFPGRFLFDACRDNFDYLYLREKLVTLSGKKLHAKRNHINRFKEDHPDWRYEAITPENIEECREMCQEWYARMEDQKSESLGAEKIAVASAFDHFFALELRGGLIRTEGKIVAFSMGAPLSQDTFVVHVEKAFPEIQGAYPIINQQFVTHQCEGFLYINREDDLGEEGLRKAKLSYGPCQMVEKYQARLQEEKQWL